MNSPVLHVIERLRGHDCIDLEETQVRVVRSRGLFAHMLS
jgi:hypothetical protein